MKIGPPQLNSDFAVGFYGFRPTLPDKAFLIAEPCFENKPTKLEKPILPPLPAKKRRP